MTKSFREPCHPLKIADETTVSIPFSEVMSGKPFILPQDDNRIINYIWSNNLLKPPSRKKYVLAKPHVDPSSGQGQYVRKLLKNMKNGFFVECGALDGETRSNTLFMEKNLNWTGLLVEADPKNFALLQMKHRKAWMSSTCLAVKPYPHTATFLQSFSIGKIVSSADLSEHTEHVEVQCIPLYSLLTALNVTIVDYFSLDVEGAELQVLKTIPFDKVFIRKSPIQWKFMESNGYRMHGKVEAQLHLTGKFADDFMFVHKNVKLDD